MPRAIETIDLQANGLTFRALACGAGPLALCAHGFPETAATFDRTLEALADLGLRAVAPHMRGYWPSSVAGVERFHANLLAEDLLAMGDALSPDAPFVLIGHDWGAIATYRAAAMAPERLRHVVTVGIPHPLTMKASIGLAWDLRHFALFQLTKRAAAKMRANDFAGVDELYRRWSPAWQVDPSETAPVKEAFRHDGCLEAALSYYRHFVKQTKDEARYARELDARPVRVPTTIVLGLADGAITPKRVRERPEIFVGGVETVWIEGAGHFLHRERPDQWLAVLRRVLPAP